MGLRPRVNHRRYWSIFLLVGALLSGSANYTVHGVSWHFDQEQRQADHKMLTRSILVDLLDTETGLRGYLVTGQHEFLRPYHEGVGRLQADLAGFRSRVPPTDQAQVIDNLSSKLLTEFVGQIDLSEKEGIDAARKRFINNPTKPTMDLLRDNIATVRAGESTLLEDTRGALRKEIATTVNLLNISTFGGLVMSLALATSLLSPPGTEED